MAMRQAAGMATTKDEDGDEEKRGDATENGASRDPGDDNNKDGGG
jgi:hypothetical protein